MSDIMADAVAWRLFGTPEKKTYTHNFTACSNDSLATGASMPTPLIMFLVCATFCFCRHGTYKSLCCESVVLQCNTSLKSLGLDCIDLYYLHSPDIGTDIDNTLDGTSMN